MRAVEVRDAIQSSMEGITPDQIAHAGDKFRIAPPTLDYPPTFDVSVTYLPPPTIQDRVLNDGDLIVDAIKLLESTYSQILFTELRGAADFEDQSGNRLCTWSIRVVYDRRNA